MTATATERLGISILRIRLGTALQKHRLQRGLTQAELAEFADLSLKYVGEIERGEANTTLEVLERLAAAVEWNPMDALEGLREPLSEGVRMLLLDEVQQILERLRNMTKWLQALDPALHARAPRPQEDEHQRLRVGRPSRKKRRQIPVPDQKDTVPKDPDQKDTAQKGSAQAPGQKDPGQSPDEDESEDEGQDED
jgi:transcriptional regulator with XRE-family HTH domain